MRERESWNALAASGVDDALRRGDASAVERIVGKCLGDRVRLADIGFEPKSVRSGSAQL